jgi:hypothetical protein
MEARDTHPQLARDILDAQRLVEVVPQPLDRLGDTVGGATQGRELMEPATLRAQQEPVNDLPDHQRCQEARFTPENRKANQAVVDLVGRIAAKKQATPAQIALAWVLAQKPWIVPIPGTTKLHRLEENLGAVDIELTPDDLQEIESATAQITVQGARYSESSQKAIDR